MATEGERVHSKLIDHPGFHDQLRDAIAEGNARAAGSLVDIARADGSDYAQLCELACKLTGIKAAEWDALLQEADDLESGGGT